VARCTGSSERECTAPSCGPPPSAFSPSWPLLGSPGPTGVCRPVRVLRPCRHRWRRCAPAPTRPRSFWPWDQLPLTLWHRLCLYALHFPYQKCHPRQPPLPLQGGTGALVLGLPQHEPFLWPPQTPANRDNTNKITVNYGVHGRSSLSACGKQIVCQSTQEQSTQESATVAQETSAQSQSRFKYFVPVSRAAPAPHAPPRSR
jgi:hypothetical protein